MRKPENSQPYVIRRLRI